MRLSRRSVVIGTFDAGPWKKLVVTHNYPSRHRFTGTFSARPLANTDSMAVQYWLMKTEPTTYSIDDLATESSQTTCWEGVRNYQARNLLRDEIHKGDRVLFYHSACKEPAVVGTAVVARGGYPDSDAFDPRSQYFDEKSDPDDPRWFMVDIKLDKKFARPVTLTELRKQSVLKGMVLLQKGSRLSVQPVKKKEFDAILKIAGVW